jgi:hypothetical protein
MYLPYKFKKLDVEFDVERLLQDLERIPPEWWRTHRFDGTSHDVVALISHKGRLQNPDGSDNHSLLPPFESTEHLRQLPYFAAVLDSFGAPPSRSRLMRVGPGENVKAHQDANPHWNNKVRIHIPVVTDPGVRFHVWSESAFLREADHESVHMAPGEAWVFNGWYYHAVTNDSDKHRVHLVGDFEPTGRLFDLLFGACTPTQMSDWEMFDYPEYEVDPAHAKWATAT